MTKLSETVFRCYADGFLTRCDRFDRDIVLKREHTLRVTATAGAIAAAHFGSDDRIGRLAWAAALLHDWSRFEQLKKFGTFNDSRSFDHGRRSREMIAEQHLLDDLPAKDAAAIAFAVEFHNKLSPPPAPDSDSETLLKIVRDADKLDIMQILVEALKHPDDPVVTLNLPAGDVSPDVAVRLAAHRAPGYPELKTSGDFIASHVLWAWDLNFKYTQKCFLADDLPDKLLEFLPPSPELDRLRAEAKDHLTPKTD